MSYVSSPLQMPVVGSRRTFSPYRVSAIIDILIMCSVRINNMFFYLQSSKRYSNGLQESDEEEPERSPARGARRREARVYRNPYIEEDDDDDDFLVPTFVPRRNNERVTTYRPNPKFSSRVVEDEEDEKQEPRYSSKRQGGYQQRSRQQSSRNQKQEYDYKVESPTDAGFRGKKQPEFNQDFSDDHISDEEVNVSYLVCSFNIRFLFIILINICVDGNAATDGTAAETKDEGARNSITAQTRRRGGGRSPTKISKKIPRI